MKFKIHLIKSNYQIRPNSASVGRRKLDHNNCKGLICNLIQRILGKNRQILPVFLVKICYNNYIN